MRFCVSEEKFRFVKVAAARPSGGELGRMALTGSPKLASLKLQSKDETGKKRNNRQTVDVFSYASSSTLYPCE